MDAQSEDDLLVALLKELRRKNEREDQLRAVIAKATDTMVLVNQTCQRILEPVDRLDARVTLLAAGAAE